MCQNLRHDEEDRPLSDDARPDTRPDESRILSEHQLTQSRVRRRRRRRRLHVEGVPRVLLLVLAALVVLGMVQLLWSLMHLSRIEQKVGASRAALQRGEFGYAEDQMAAAHDSAAMARWGSVGPHLWLAEYLPVVGDDIDAVRGIAKASAELTGPVAEDFFAIRRTLDPEAIKPVDGRIDLARFATGAEQVGEVEDAVRAVEEEYLHAVEGGQVGPLDAVVDDFTEEVVSASDSATFVSDVLDMVPALLGAEGPRRYLVAFQNNAEFRATGGIPGAFAVLTADRGRLEMGAQGGADDFGDIQVGRPVVELTPEERALFQTKLGTFPQDVNFTPDWSRSGGILRAMWKRAGGAPVDGVFSIDPVALGKVLEGTGPLKVADGRTVTAQNAAQTLLNLPYLVYPKASQQDEFFEESARRIFRALIKGEGDAGTALEQLHEALEEGRVYAWLADPEEQRRIAGSQVAGELTTEPQRRPQVGVYLNDATGTKLDYYITSQTSVQSTACSGDGRQILRVRTVLRSLVPRRAEELPLLLVGPTPPTGVPGEVLTTVLAYAPVGGEFLHSSMDGEEGASAGFTHEGHPVLARTVALTPGQSRVLEYELQTGPNQRGRPELRVTPTSTGTGVAGVDESAC